MDIAIQMQPMFLEYDRIIFVPVGLIKGFCDLEKGIFIDEYGFRYDYMEGSNPYGNRYFGMPTQLDDLKRVYFALTKESEILQSYLHDNLDMCYLGYYDNATGNIKLVEVDFKDIEYDIQTGCYGYEPKEQEEVVNLDLQNNLKFLFNKETLEVLKNKNNMDEVRAFIDEIISAGEYIKRGNGNINDSENVEEGLTIKDKKRLELKKEESSKFNLKDMRDFIFSEIIAQDEAVKRITACIMSNFDSSNPKRKSHLLLTGPTGTGKSKTIQLICEYLNIPYAKVDSTDYTQTGYVGRSVDEMLEKLINAANGDVELAQKGILVIDEIDKKATNNDSSNVATKSVLDSLLKITGRGTVEVDIVEDGKKKTIDFDTSNLTVIFTGAFEGIEKLGVDTAHKQVGFILTEENKKSNSNNIHKLLMKYGMTPELIGRIKCIVPLKKYDEKDYIKILKYSKGSPLIIEKEYYEKDKGIKFTYTSSFVEELAKQAVKLNVGARGLETVTAIALEDVQERVLNGEKIKVLKLTKKTALNNKEYYFE